MSKRTRTNHSSTFDMEFFAQKSDLLKELDLIQGVVEKKVTIPILSNARVTSFNAFYIVRCHFTFSWRPRRYCELSTTDNGPRTTG